MNDAAPKPSILLVDDTQNVLDGLVARLADLLPEDQVEVRRWLPTAEDDDPQAVFDSKVDDSTILVATDYDLTSQGAKGLFGLTIVGWCQKRSIPVGDFSRGNATALPKEPNLFELRVPPTDVEGAQFIAAAFTGFRTIRDTIAADPELLTSKRSLAAVLATLLGKPHLDNQFALYMSRLGSANSSLVQRLRDFANPAEAPDNDDKVQVLTYVLGHVLLNAILKFPGPLLSERALCAYVSTAQSEADALHDLFAAALYRGPFGESARYYWREDVDAILDRVGGDAAEKDFEDFGDLNRAVTEVALERPLAHHECPRCGGTKGGFLCPFTHRPVCQRPDCSVSASSWIPSGAQLSRVERDFYDEWAPLLGL